MLSDTEFVRQSLELNLFFARIAKEHSFFIEVAIPSKNSNLILEAEIYKNEFARLLAEAVRLSDGVLPQEFTDPNRRDSRGHGRKPPGYRRDPGL